jgi:Ca2+-binding EF-hand superfamily protein
MINLDVNLVVWAEHKEKAKYLASMISRGKIVRIPEVYQLEVQIPPSGDQSEYLLSIKCFYCWARSYLLNTPENLTDILILNIEGTDTKYLEEAINFADFRRSVPIKYMVSNEDISDIAIKLDCEFAYEDHVKEASFIQKIIDETKDIDFTLRKVFNRIDTDGNGFINYKELKNKSKELAYKMTEEESKEIVYTLSKDGNIRYEDFKKWWIMGKQDFIYFRRLVDYELNFNNLLQVTSPFLKKLKIEMERVSSKYLEHESKITIVSREENQYSEFYQDFIFYPATILSAKLVTGMEVESLLESLPRYIKSDPLTFGIELCLISSEFGAHVIALLKEIKDNLKESEFYKEILKLGFTVNFRHVYKTIYI